MLLLLLLFTSTDLKKRLERASIVWKVKPKNFDGGHLTRTNKAAGPSVESMASQAAWIIKCHLTDFLAFGSYVFDILVYSATCLLWFFVWVLPICY